MSNWFILRKIQSIAGTMTAQLGFSTIALTSIFTWLLDSIFFQDKAIILLFMIGGIAILISSAVAKWVTNPLRALASSLQALDQDQFTPQKVLVKAAKRSNQIGHLVRTFLSTAETIQHRESQLREKIAALHLKVDGAWQVEVLLQELMSCDVQWLASVGTVREVDPNETLTWNNDLIDTVYIILEGVLTMGFHHHSSASGSLVHAVQLSSGEVLGALPSNCGHETFIALETGLLWAIPRSILETKLMYDAGFAARFQKAVAVLLSRRLHRITENVPLHQMGAIHAVRDVLFVLGEFHDSDIDWLVAKGERKRISANTVLVREGGPVDGLYVLLEGVLDVLKSGSLTNSLVYNLLPPPEGQDRETIAGRLYKGELFGLMPFVDAHQPSKTIKAVEDCLVLHIPRQQLMVKLNQDVGFAARFYGVVAKMLTNRLQSRLSHLLPENSTKMPQISHNGRPDQSELDFGILDHMAIAGTRFNWMINRLSGTEPA